jgi:predicted transcriptional regulator
LHERTATEIAKWINESPATVSSALARLAACGQVRRRRGPGVRAPQRQMGGVWLYQSNERSFVAVFVDELRRVSFIDGTL